MGKFITWRRVELEERGGTDGGRAMISGTRHGKRVIRYVSRMGVVDDDKGTTRATARRIRLMQAAGFQPSSLGRVVNGLLVLTAGWSGGGWFRWRSRVINDLCRRSQYLLLQ